MAGRKKLGQVLIDAGAIDEFQLRAALAQQERWGRRLGMNLISMGFIREQDLVGALSSQLGIPIAHLAEYEMKREMVEVVSRELAEKYMVLPLALKGPGNRTVVLGMEDPCDLAAVDTLGFRTGMTIEPALMAPSELAAGIGRLYYGRTQEDEAETADFVLEPSGRGAAQGAQPPRPADDDFTGHADDAMPDLATPFYREAAASSEEDANARVDTRTILQALAKLLIDKQVIESRELTEMVARLSGRGDS